MNIKIKVHYTKFIVLVLLIIFLLNGVIENILIKGKIKSFTRGAELVEVDVENGLKLYAVSRETLDCSLNKIDNVYYSGSNGDILLKKSSPFKGFPIVHELVGFFFGGHAGIVTDDLKQTIEVVGNTSNNKVSYYVNDWINLDECIGVRLKNKDIIDDVIDSCKDKLGSKYNYSFIFDNGYYCTELIEDSIYEIDKKGINDFGLTTINDIILSKNVEICYYHYTDNNGIKHIYYID